MRRNSGGLAKNLMAFRELGTVLLLVIVVGLAAMKEPRFLQPFSLNSILLWVPLIAVIGMGQMMVIVTRGIDVSVGSITGLSAMAAGMLFRAHPEWNVLIGVALAIVVGMALGGINAALISAAKVPPIIATLGTLSVYRGLTFVVSHGEQVDSNHIPDALIQWSGEGPLKIGGVTISWLLIIALAVAALAGWFVKSTRAGRDVFAVGSNPEAARLRGIPVARVTALVYTITGALAGLAGILYASRFAVVNPATAGQGLELIVIAAVVIGGTNVTGGSGSVLGVLLGSLLLGVINVALAVLGISETWQQLVYGVVILMAVVFDTAVQRQLRQGEAA